MCNHKFMTFGWDKNGSYRVCSKCNEKVYVTTNADNIRTMSNEELASFLCQCRFGLGEDDECLRWLESEHKGTKNLTIKNKNGGNV